jgi:uncharacterized protein (DUF952 family)
MRLVFKICTAREWEEATRTGHCLGSPDDLRDGFIHLSASHQLAGTAVKHFSGKNDLVLAAFSDDQLGPQLKWEESRGGDLFPHFHGALPVAHALWVKPLPWHDGKHRFPVEAGL